MKYDNITTLNESRALLSVAPLLPDHLIELERQGDNLPDEVKGALLTAALLLKAWGRTIEKQRYLMWKQENAIKRLKRKPAQAPMNVKFYQVHNG